MNQPDWILAYLFLFVALAVMMVGTRALPNVTQVRRLKAWQVFAEQTGLAFMPGAFFGDRQVPTPKVSGKYRGRMVMCSAHTRGSLGFFDSQTEISVSVSNQPSRRYPQGGVFILQRCWLGHAWLEEKRIDQLQLLFHVGYHMVSDPESLGNHMRRQPVLKKMMQSPGLKDLILREQKLLMHKNNVDLEPARLHALVDTQCDIAEIFEKYSIWLR